MVSPLLRRMSPLHYDNLTERNIDAEQQAASQYYASSIQSLAQQPQYTAKDNAATAVENKAEEKSIFGKVKDWFWGILGMNKEQPASNVSEQEITKASTATSPSIPRLSPPEMTEKKQLISAAEKLNRYFKVMAETDEEIKRGVDQLIFYQLFLSTLNQKDLKEDNARHIHHIVINRNNNSKVLHHTFYNLMDDAKRCELNEKILNWVDKALTAAALVTIFASIGATGGLAGPLLPIATTLKGLSTGSSGLYKYQENSRKADMEVIKHEIKENAAKISEELSDAQDINDALADLDRTIREELKKLNETKRSFSSKR